MAFMPTGFRALSALTRVQTRPWTPPHVLHLNARRLATVVDRSPAPNFHIPLIDFGKFLSATSIEEKQSTANEIAQGFKEVGFIYISNHGIPESQVSSVHEKSAEFFRQPAQLKDSLAWEDPRSNRGYVKIGRERVTQSADADEIKALRAKAPDFKETMEIGRDWDATWRNRWPQETDVPGFKQTMLNFFYSCHKLHVHVLRAVALGLQLDERFFDEKIDEQYHNLRLLNYPAVKTSLLAGEDSARAGAHSDYGTLTLLFQDQVGGLQVRNPHTLEYQPAPPIPGTIVVNAGDLLARWSNDVLRSTLHRVVAPPTQRLSDTEGIVPARQSIAFFCNPNGGATIECLPNCGEKSKYEPVTTEDYIVGRLRATYT